MEEDNFTQKESLELISRMIKESRTNIEKGGGNIYLMWGYLWLIISLVIYFIISKTGNYSAYWIWFAIPLIGFPSMAIMLKNKQKHAITFVEKVISIIWIVLGLCALLLSLFMLIDYSAFPILFVMALIINAGVAMSGLVIKFKPIAIAGIIGIFLSFILLLITGLVQILIFGCFSIFMLIIPGHILNAASKKYKNNV